MQKQYESPEAEILVLSVLDVITASPGLNNGSEGSGGGNISFNEWLDKLGDNGTGTDGDGLDIDINDLLGN